MQNPLVEINSVGILVNDCAPFVDSACDVFFLVTYFRCKDLSSFFFFFSQIAEYVFICHELPGAKIKLTCTELSSHTS